MSNDSLLEVEDTDTNAINEAKEAEKPIDTDVSIKPEKPESLPIEYWDAEKNTVKTDDLIKAYESEKSKALGLRQKLSKGFQDAPKDVSGYQLEWDDEETPLDEDNPMLATFKEIAFENKLNQEQFNGFLKSFHKAFKEGKLEQTQEMSEAQNKEWQETEMKRLGSNHKQIVDGYKSWGRSLVQNKVLTEDEFAEFVKMPASAEHIKILTKLKQASGYINDIPQSGVSVDGGKTREEIDALIASPEYGDEIKGAAIRKTVADYFKSLHPS